MDINIGKVIGDKRKEFGITQETLAVYCGVTKASVSKWESGQSYPDISILPILASYFRISIDELIDYEPQMDKDRIHKLYIRLSGEFGAENFESVYSEVKDIVRRYFSCYPLILQMTVLLVNHNSLAKTPEMKKEVLDYAESLSEKLIRESTDAWVVGQAKSLKATIYMIGGEYNKIINVLDEDIRPIVMNETILATAYTNTGQNEKAEECLQIYMMNYLMGIAGNMPLLLMNNLQNKDRKINIIDKMLALEKIFDLDSFQPNTMAQMYMCIAYSYVVDGDKDKAIKMLERYCNICTKDFSSFRLHGNEFFDKVDIWLENFNLGRDTPRTESVVRADMKSAIADSPCYIPLHDEPEFKRIIERLELSK